MIVGILQMGYMRELNEEMGQYSPFNSGGGCCVVESTPDIFSPTASLEFMCPKALPFGPSHTVTLRTCFRDLIIIARS